MMVTGKDSDDCIEKCDTPGMMVGPKVEKTALVRHCCRLFLIGANLTVPHVVIVLRKSYGLGAQAMAGGDLGLMMSLTRRIHDIGSAMR